MIAFIKKAILRVRYQRALKLWKKEKRPSFKNLRTIGVLLDGGLNVDERVFLNLALALGVSKANVKLLVYNRNKRNRQICENPNGNMQFFDSGDIGFLGKLSPKLKSFVNSNFDLIVNYYNAQIIDLQLISSSFKTSFRVGFPEADKQLNDLNLSIDESDTALFVMEMVKYVKTIFKK